MEKNPWLRALLVLLVIIAGYYLISLAWQVGQQVADIFLMFFLAWLLAFILTPLTRLLTRYNRQQKLLAIIEIYVGMILLLILLGFLALPAMVSQMSLLGTNLPSYSTGLPQALTSVQSWLEARGIVLNLSSLLQSQGLMQAANGLGSLLAQNALGIAQFLASTVVGLFIVLVLSFYIMLDGERIAQDLLKLLPSRYQEEARFFMGSIDQTFGGFMRGVLIQAAIYGAGTALIMRLAGLDFIEVVSVFSGAMMVIPFLGGFLAIIPAFFIALFSGSLGKVVFVLVALLVLQQIVLNVVTPKVMSESVGIHPLLVFLAILLGFKVAGIWGAIFGVPVAGVVSAMAQYLLYRGQSATLFRTSAEPPPGHH